MGKKNDEITKDSFEILPELLSYMFSCAAFIALAAKPMFLSTSVLVLAFSRASLWNSIVDKVPSI